MAMFVINMQWLQVLVFLFMNMISVYYLVLILPYEAKSNNFLNIFNEAVSVNVAILIAMANAVADQPLNAYQIGDFIVWTLYFSWAANFLIVMFLILKELV